MFKIKLKFKKELFTFVSLIFIVVLELFFIFQVIATVTGANRKISFLQKEISQFQKDQSQKNLYMEKISTLEEHIKALHEKFITVQQVSSLLSFISLESKRFAVEIQQIKPQNLLPKKDSQKLKKVSYLPINITLKANFHNLAAFLDFLQTSNYFLDVKELELVSDSPQHTINLILWGLIKE